MSDFDLLEDDLDASTEDDWDVDDELATLLEDDEARRRLAAMRRARTARRPVRTGQGAGYYRPRPSPTNVTQAQLQSSLERISKDVKANAAAIKTLGGRVDTIAAAQTRQAAELRKDRTARRGELNRLRNNLQMAAILPLVARKTVTVSENVAGIPKDTKLVEAGDTMSALLPMMLLGDGMGGSGGDSSTMMVLAIALSGLGK